MLSAEENELLTHVGPGTPVGDLIRQYWIPALMSSELSAPDGPPLRVRLLGENLIAFRTPPERSGRWHTPSASRPHFSSDAMRQRGSGACTRLEFDVAGQCLECHASRLTATSRTKCVPEPIPVGSATASSSPIWGRGRIPPPLPDLEPNLLSDGQTEIWTALRECNWVQAMEGDIDTAHLGLLHLGGVSPDDVRPGTFDYYTVKDRAPKYKVVDTEWGTMYGAYRPAAEETYYWRIAQFLFPFYTLIPTGVLGVQVLVRAWVPLDDHHTMFWSLSAPSTRLQAGIKRSSTNGQPFAGTTGRPQFLPNTTDWLGRWRLAANASNDYLIDREVQRTQSYTGIDGIHLQDQAITESMGAIADRAQEHLGTSDAMIIRTRHG